MNPSADPIVGPALRLADVVKQFGAGAQAVRALDGVSLEVPRGQFLAVVGRSGSGKSTLLNLAAGIDTPSSGEVWIDGRPISRLDDDALTLLRRDRIGVVYQFFDQARIPTLFSDPLVCFGQFFLDDANRFLA